MKAVLIPFHPTGIPRLMDNQRLILFFSLAAVLFLIYESWMQDYGQPALAPIAVEQQTATAIPQAARADIPTINTTPMVADAAMREAGNEPVITVETDVLKLEISPRGGTINNAWLLGYAITPEHPDEHLQLLKAVPPNMFITQSGLIGDNTTALPTHEAVFQTAATHYQLDANQEQLEVVFTWRNETGTEVQKRYTFNRGSYVISVQHIVRNASEKPLIAREYTQLQRTEFSDLHESKFVKSYIGGVYYSPEEKYKKISFEEMATTKLDRAVADGWIAMIQHYFMAAWIPPRTAQATFYTNVLNNSRYIIGTYSPVVSIAPQASYTFENQLFIGPKLTATLAEVAPGLDLVVDYGWLTIIAQPIHWVLNAIHALVGNWGWAIIFLTILIKLAFYKLSETSYKSMANMRQLTPRLQALKDRYGDDKQRLNQAMMEMYKTEKINPLGGCLPILIQIPVFIALYWVLLESVEMRQAPFMLWLNNLSAPDQYFVLPLIMGVSMFVQQKLNPAPPDPIQAKVMMSLPFVFTVFFAFFPSGLVLYWTVNNLLSIAQQWHITRNIERAAAKQKR
jgi:YidC/Oxa1 family membrane protein insertase